MVWIHGGSVVVTVNHRLNPFGYIQLGDKDERFADAGNAGVSNLVAVLRWVRANAPAFGGGVTGFGQSNGVRPVPPDQ